MTANELGYEARHVEKRDVLHPPLWLPTPATTALPSMVGSSVVELVYPHGMRLLLASRASLEDWSSTNDYAGRVLREFSSPVLMSCSES